MARLYAATGDAISRLDKHHGAWQTTLSLIGTGAQCLALDPSDRDVVYAGLREGGVRRTTDGGASWVDCGLPAPGTRASQGGRTRPVAAARPGPRTAATPGIRPTRGGTGTTPGRSRSTRTTRSFGTSRLARARTRPMVAATRRP